LAPSPDEIADWLGPLAAAGVDLFHCSQRRYWTPEFPELDGEQGLTFAGWVKKLTGAATICVGSVGLSNDSIAAFSGESSTPQSLEPLLRRLERDEFDLIAVGRALISEPNWVRKVRGDDPEPLRGYNPAILREELI
jgi:2,4-dienoyl-CoA reductase-like NADH-dependent reductase (Old Yellow Enzyme family)